jgi:Flp pilus assembly protein CpaB
MKTRGGKFLLLLGGLLAAMAFVVVYVVMSGKLSVGSGDNAATVPDTAPVMVDVAVVNRDLPAYTLLDASNVATVSLEESTVPTDTTTSPATLYGKMTLVPLTKGQVVNTAQLTESGFADILAKGERAFVLAVPEKSTFGDAIMENDHVDLVWSTSIKGSASKLAADGTVTYEDAVYTTTKTLLQNIHVMRVMTLAQDVVAGSNGQATNASAGDANTAPIPAPSTAAMYLDDAPYQTVLVLGVTDQQAEVIAFARQNGSVDLTLRSSAVQKDDTGAVIKDAAGNDVRGDTDVEKTTGITLDTLIKEYGLPSPANCGCQP